MKILVTSTFVTPFITQDLELLGKHYDVEHLVGSGPRAPLSIARRVHMVDIVFVWFASTYASAAVFAARRFGKRSLIAIGGADVAAIPELGYGLWLSPWKSLLAGYALRNADKVLAVDTSLMRLAARRAQYDGDNLEYLPTGFDAQFWTPEGEKEPFVLTVAVCDTEERLKVKGIDMLVETARRRPEIPFRIVGIHDRLLPKLRASAPHNLTIQGRVERYELRELYRRAKVYCQPSAFEGLPGAVCEAMLCGCVPVGTDVGGIATAMADVGFVVPYGDLGGLVYVIESALGALPVQGEKARASIAGRFTMERREQGLLGVIEELSP
ncbi:MAG: glycosyltransferase family 4 protein [Bacteroidota bacterium]